MTTPKNKFGFRPLRRKPAGQAVKPPAPKPKARPVASAGRPRAKRANPANPNLGGAPVIEISDDEDEDVGNSQSRRVPANPPRPYIIDLTIESPPSEGSPEPPPRSSEELVMLEAEESVMLDRGDPDMLPAEGPAILGARDPVQLPEEVPAILEREVTVDSEVQYQFSFQRSRSDAFAGVVKTEVEEEVSLTPPCPTKYFRSSLTASHSTGISVNNTRARGDANRTAHASKHPHAETHQLFR